MIPVAVTLLVHSTGSSDIACTKVVASATPTASTQLNAMHYIKHYF